MSRLPKLKADARFVLLGADSMLDSLKAIGDEVQGVKEALDIENVHRMRVATRRLRAKLKVFGEIFSAKQSKAWTREIRRLTRSLGAARDCDVQLFFLDNFRAAHPDEKSRAGIARLELRIRQRRAGEQEKVVNALARIETGKVLENMSDTLRELRVMALMQSPGERQPGPETLGFARAALATGTMELLSHEIYLQGGGAARELHQMRIAAKRLRYTMEIFTPWFPDLLPKTIKLVKKTQELLGDIHDCDVWLATLPVFMEEERERARDFYGKPIGTGKLRHGLAQIEKDRAGFRAERFNELLEHWPKMIGTPVWRKLVKESMAETEDTPAAAGTDPAPGNPDSRPADTPAAPKAAPDSGNAAAPDTEEKQ